MADVVYIVRSGPNEELRYSLRSLANLPHDRVWIFGPEQFDWLTNVEYVEVPEVHEHWHERATAAWTAVTAHPFVSEEFILMNDDFFILKPIAVVPVLHRGTLTGLLAEYARHISRWSTGLRHLRRVLRDWGYSNPVSYDLHVPLPVRKSVLAQVLARVAAVEVRNCFAHIHRRTLYGMVADIGGEYLADPKIYDLTTVPGEDWIFVSTAHAAFRDGAAGVWIRERFPQPGQYEQLALEKVS